MDIILERPAGAPAAKTLDEIARVAAGLDQWNKANQALFTSAGEGLRGLHRKVSLVRQGIRRCVEAVGSADMSDMRESLVGAAGEARAVSDMMREYAGTLQRLRGSAELATAGSDAIVLVFRLLEYVVLLARIQIESLPSGQTELNPLTVHMHELVETGDGVARFIDQHLRSLSASLVEGDGAVAGGEALDASARMVEKFAQLAQRLGSQQRSAGEQNEIAHGSFTVIWKRIGLLVGDLQFQDVARQRLDHTTANLGHAVDLAWTGTCDGGRIRLPDEARGCAIGVVARLETAQLLDLAALYRENMAAFSRNLEAIRDAIGDSVLTLERLSRREAGAAGVAMLNSEGARLRDSFRRSEDLRGRLGDSLNECVTATAPLIVKLAEVEHELHIAGVNAAVQAAHFAGGENSVGYIAGIIREQAAIAREEADHVRMGIQEAAAATRRMSEEVLPSLAATELQIERRLAGAADVLTRIDATCAGAIASTLVVAAQLQSDLAEVFRLADTSHEGIELMGKAAEFLAGLDGTVPAAAGEVDLADLLALLRGSYTTEEERRIFEAALGDLIGSGHDAPTPADVDASGGLELF